jgi:hypothetical protein
MTNDTQKQSTKETTNEATGKNEEHLPEWVRVFEDLEREAKELYADGRVKIIVPKRQPRKRS